MFMNAITALYDIYTARKTFNQLSHYMNTTLTDTTSQEYKDCVAVLDHLRKRM